MVNALLVYAIGKLAVQVGVEYFVAFILGKLNAYPQSLIKLVGRFYPFFAPLDNFMQYDAIFPFNYRDTHGSNT